MSEVKTLTCWRIGKTVLTSTFCNHFDKKCGDVERCHFKTGMAKVNFLRAQSEGQVVEKEREKGKVLIDDGFF